jgi:dachs
MQTQKNIHPVSAASTTWALGKRHIFLSEGARQQLEMLRSERRNISASLIQAMWRGWNLRRRWPLIKQNLIAQNFLIKSNHTISTNATNRPRPQPITGTPPPSPQNIQSKSLEMCPQNVIQETCTLFGIDLVC